jgi:ribosomal protein S11/lipopolysaccharide export system protein LptA
MTSRAAVLVLAGTIAVASCGRSGQRPRAATGTPAAADTAAERLAREAADRVREDSIKASLAAPTPPPVASAPSAPTTPPVAATAAPERRCVLDLLNTDSTRAQRIQDPTTKKYFTYIGGGLVGHCRGQDIDIRADSAESYEINDLHILIGRVKYREARYAIDADRVTYFRAEERLLFQGNVHAVMTKDAATMDAPQLEYFRPVRGIRDRERIVATQRPRLTYVEKDSAGRDQPPVTVLANTIIGDGDSTFHAMGDVRMERSDVTAVGDSALLDGARHFSRLMKGPVVESKGTQPFTLKGRMIELYGSGRQVERVLAIDSASAVSKEFTLVSDTIDLRVKGEKLDRAFAFGPAGAHATTKERDIVADSLDIVMPGQRIRELRAIGKAFAESDPDSTKIVSDERDWIRGDTLIARFDSLAAADTTTPRVRDIFASGEASAYYQIPADSSDRSKPGINYVTGRVIRLSFKDGDVQDVTVTDQVSGVYLAPLPKDSVTGRGRPTRPPASAPGARRPPGRGGVQPLNRWVW